MKIFYSILLLFVVNLGWSSISFAQKCHLLKATIQTSESRCAATGSIIIEASGGSGSYKFKVDGPVNTDFTTTPNITGLSAGNYKVTITDIVTNCTLLEQDIIVGGNYEDPRFGLTSTDVTCDNGNNGRINVQAVQHGRAPFSYAIVAPSPYGVGTSNNTGIFSDLIAGDYSIQLRDSCGGIQTRTITINNYTWKIDSHNFTKFSCDSASGSIKVSDSKGNVSTIQGLPGFLFGFIGISGDTSWSDSPNFRIGANGLNSVKLFAKDICGKIKQITATFSFLPSLDNNVRIYNKECGDFSAEVLGIKNFTNPNFCLYDENDALIECNQTGKFYNLDYRVNYCIKALDECSGTTITRCFNQQPEPIFIDNDVIISNKNCLSFDAAVTGLNGFNQPYFILFKDSSEFISTNNTGVFENLDYGDYCIMTQDGCRDTSIRQCFMVMPPIPRVDSVMIPSYVTCVDFGLTVGGDNLTHPTYCLYDNDNLLIACNNTGIFDNIPLGSYCVTVHDDCLDSTFIRCFSVGPPVVPNDVVVNISNKTCDNFTASVSTINYQHSGFCLFGQDNSLIRCDSSGIFTNLPYGNYYITSKSLCPDTTVITHFSASPPIPRVHAIPTMNNKTCNTFSVNIKGQQNLTNPQYFLVNSNEEVIAANTTGKFDGVLYGSYCIRIVNQCYDTTMSVCFSNTATPLALSGSASKSCNYGFSKFALTFTGNFPVNIKIKDPDLNQIHDKNYTSSGITIDNLPDLEEGKFYTILATDNCGNEKSMTLAPVIGYLNHSLSVTQKCPGSIWANGSGNLHATASTNTGILTVRIIKKDLMPLAPFLIPDAVSGPVYSFNDLGPGSYIVRFNSNDGCNVYLYDTVDIKPYSYPELNKSSAYQCDVNGFSVGSVVTNGVGPFTYSIIGSIPDAPSIIAGPQNNPVFNVDNGSMYSLIRLRALDACGNATLGDASILPMANNRISVSENCFNLPVDLTIDEMYNSTATWYKKENIEDDDSLLIGTGFGYHIPSLMPQDTGIYICHLEVNNGCIQRLFYMNITGDCYPPLAVGIVNFDGMYENDKVFLNWKTPNGNELRETIVERKIGNNFDSIGRVEPQNVKEEREYRFIDPQPSYQNYYRLKFIHKNNQITFSKILHIKAGISANINIYPNPVEEVINVEFNKTDNIVYHVSLFNTLHQKVKEVKFANRSGKLIINRSSEMKSGIYVLRIESQYNNEVFTFKIILK